MVTVPAFPHDHDPDMWGRTIEVDGNTATLTVSNAWFVQPVFNGATQALSTLISISMLSAAKK